MKSRNPVLPTSFFFPDGEPHLIDGELYIYPSCDTQADGYCSDKLYVVHSKDLSSWKIEGPVLDCALLNSMHSLPEGFGNGLLYAPDCLTVNGKSYLFFCTSDGYEGVAFSDSPSGPFSNPVLITADKSGEYIKGIDPAVLYDDGKAYLYWGQFSSFGAELTDDFTRIKEDTLVSGILTESEHGFHEGSSLRKINGKYYYIFADIHRGKPTALGYAVSDAPLGKYEYKGIIIDNDGCDPETWNNHGSIEYVDGRWYVFYHRSTGNSRFLRRMCAEPIFFERNGMIKEAVPTSIGMGEAFKPGERIYAYQACSVSKGAYISDDKLIVTKGKSKIVFRYIDTSCCPLSVDFASEGSVSADYEIDSDGTLTVYLNATTDARISYFIIH